VDQDAIIEYIVETFDGVDVEAPTDGVGAGDTFFIYDPDRNFEPKHRFPFATIVAKNYKKPTGTRPRTSIDRVSFD